MKTKKTPAAPKPTRGRPRLYGERIIWNILIDPNLVAAVDLYRQQHELSQSQVVVAALRKLIGKR